MESQKFASNMVFEQGLSELSFLIYDAIDKSGNELISPYSISAALMLLILGTDGTTKTQMMTSIFKSEIPDNVHQSFKTLNDQLLGRTEAGVTLSIANRLFGSQIYTLLDTYTTDALRYNGSKMELLDFAWNPEETRVKINSWIAEQTNDKIRDMIPRNVLNQYTAVVLVNAIYFKGNWKTKFDSAATSTEHFFVGPGVPKQVHMMYGKFKAISGESLDLDCKVLQLPFKGDKLSMVFILPNDIDGLSRLEKRLNKETYNDLFARIRTQETEIKIPKFTVEAEYSLIPVLKSLGITEIFDYRTANFSNMISYGGGGFYVSDARHKTFIDVNEEGSEAAAATSIVVANESVHVMKPFQFVANHPFIFTIRDNESGTILFFGRLTNL